MQFSRESQKVRRRNRELASVCEKPAAWINKKGTFGRQKFLFSCGRGVRKEKKAKPFFSNEVNKARSQPSRRLAEAKVGDYAT